MSRRDDYEFREPNWKRLHDGPMPVRTHTGGGDTIIQAGLMVELSKKYGKIAVPCYNKYWSLGESLYSKSPDITLYRIPDIHEGHLCSPTDAVFDRAYRSYGLDKEQEIRIGEYAGEGLWNDFIKAFYLRSGVDYSKRWDSCPIANILPSVKQREWPTVFVPEWCPDKRVFVHDDPSRGYRITRMVDERAFRPWFTGNALEYAKVLITADEIHCIDSTFFCLANQLPVTGKLYYHHYARPDRPSGFQYELRQDWAYLW
jgi:hypothetical protein